MQMPIPSDWDGETWECYKIWFPKSKAYTGILLGFLSAMSRGRFWDGDTGNIQYAQAIGWEVFKENAGLVNCEGRSPTDYPSPGEWPCDLAYANGLDCEEDAMGCFIDKIECRADGLYYRQCGEWHKVEGCETDPHFTEDDDTVIPIPDGEDPDDWACAKATAVADILFGVGLSSLEHREDGPIDFIHNVESDVKMDLGDSDMVALYMWLQLNSVVGEELAETLTEYNKGKFICELAPQLDGSNNDIGENQYELIGKQFQGMGGWNPLERGFLGLVVNTLRLQRLRTVTRASVLRPAGDCACPEAEPSIPVSYDWGHRYDFRLGEYGWELYSTGSGQTYEAGVGFVHRNMDDVGVGDQMVAIKKQKPSPQESTTLDYFQVEYVSWPNKTSSNICWFGVDGGACGANNQSQYGKRFVSGVVNLVLTQGQQVNVGVGPVNGVETVSGDAVIASLVIVGHGVDPWPSDPPL